MSKRRPKAPPPPTELAQTSAPVVALRRDNGQPGAPFVATPAGLEMMRDAAAKGASLAWIAAHVLRVNRETLRELRKRSPEVDEALAAGKAADRATIQNVIRDAAIAGNVIAAMFYLKTVHGFREGVEVDGAGASINVTVLMPKQAQSAEEYRRRVLDADAVTVPPATTLLEGGDDDAA